MKVTTPDVVKPAHQACEHCTMQGCGIYADRPETCATFQCLWLASQQVEQLALPATMRPDRCGVVIDLNAAGTVLAHCEFPASWKAEPMRGWLTGMAVRGHNVLLENKEGTRWLGADGSTHALRFIGIDPVSNCRVYAPETGA
jgi:hypothetical protein